SRASLFACGEIKIVYRSFFVGSGIGPCTCAPVRFAVSTISCVDTSIRRWSNALRRMRMRWFCTSKGSNPLFSRRETPRPEKRSADSSDGPGGCQTTPSMHRKMKLLDDFDDDAGTDGAAAFADREPDLLVHRNRTDQRHHHVDVIARH